MSLIRRDGRPTLISAREKRLSCIKNSREMCVFCQKDLLLRISNRCVFQKKSDDHAAPLSEWLLFAFLYTLLYSKHNYYLVSILRYTDHFFMGYNSSSDMHYRLNE